MRPELSRTTPCSAAWWTPPGEATDARHSRLDALSSTGALAGLIAVTLGQPWGDPVAGLAVTAFICHVGYQVTTDVVYRLANGVDPRLITATESAARSVPGVIHAHARARWTGRTLRVEVEGWVDPDLTARDADTLGRQAAAAIARQLPEAARVSRISSALLVHTNGLGSLFHSLIHLRMPASRSVTLRWADLRSLRSGADSADQGVHRLAGAARYGPPDALSPQHGEIPE